MHPSWHPIFLTTEISPGVWEMQGPRDYAPFGTIELRRTGDQLRYKVTLSGEIIGWSTTLQVACDQLYRARVEANDRAIRGAPNVRAGMSDTTRTMST